jgi:hypothetical protein
MNTTSASDACLNLHHVYDAAREWTHEDIVDDDGRVACEGVQSVCRSILSTVNELLTGDTDESDVNSSEAEPDDVRNEL